MNLSMDRASLRRWGGVGAACLVGLMAGLALGRLGAPEGSHQMASPVPTLAAPAAEVWTCSMHPQIRLPGPGSCPICAMDLIPVATGAATDNPGPRALHLSERARQLASVQVVPVERRFVPVETRMVGKIAFDETRLKRITAWIPGRIDRLYVDYTGVQVKAGDHMAYLYSPELLTAQEELIQALRAASRVSGEKEDPIPDTARLTLNSAREKLRLWGLKPEQIAGIEQAGQASDHLTVYAPIGGIVVEKQVSEGSYVQTGAPIYTIADLSQVWLQLEAYESDLVWVHYGQEVHFETEAYPGEPFTGRVSFIAPVLDERTRTVKVRVNVPNSDGRLKPGMLVRAVVRADAGAGGRVMDATLAGKWISPMHPEIIRDEPGTCDVCGMPLVPTESLGYAAADSDREEAPLVIPATAVLLTGKRAVVYVALPDHEGVFEGREVVLGPRAGDHYLVREGLEEGEQVVTNGAFKIDSALQIQAKRSMMNPAGGASAPVHRHGAAPTARPAPERAQESPPPLPRPRPAAVDPAAHPAPEQVQDPRSPQPGTELPVEVQGQVHRVFASYLGIQQALSRDDFAGSRQAAAALVGDVSRLDSVALEGQAGRAWSEHLHDLKDRARELAGPHAGDGGIAGVRAAFAPLSESITRLGRRFGTGLATPVYRFHCPMAFGNRGASWLQTNPEVENPYFGRAMYRCGSQEEILDAVATAKSRVPR